MTALTHIKPRFVEFIPKELEEGVLYISQTYGTASHRCACGCGMRVVTPLAPTDWRLQVNGDEVSVRPSIGNWDYPCRSHYFITRNQIVWAPQWSKRTIDEGRLLDKERKEAYFSDRAAPPRNVLVRLWATVGRWLRS